MPFGDRTGPWGQGPGTGRGAGLCSGFAAPGFVSRASGSGFFGRGRGGGRGWRNWYHATGLTGWQRAQWWPSWWPSFSGPTREQEAAALKSQADRLDGILKSIRQRIEELEAKSKEE
jgi:hypothetical protein